VSQVTIVGLERYTARINAMPDSVRKAVSDVLEQNASEFATRLKGNVPKESGDLAATVTVSDTTVNAGFYSAGSTKGLSKTVSIGNAEHPYAAALEFGHMDKGVHVQARPYFFTLLRVIKKRLSGRMSRAIKSAVRAYAADGGGE
jgi:hypothetical protein